MVSGFRDLCGWLWNWRAAWRAGVGGPYRVEAAAVTVAGAAAGVCFVAGIQTGTCYVAGAAAGVCNE